jgi:PAS domain S-box-containing protein
MTRRLAVALGAVGVVVAAYAVVTGLRLGGDAFTVALEDYGEAAAALAAVAACSLAALRAQGRLRAAWSLLALGTLSWALGEIYWAVSEVNLHMPVPFPSLADAGFLLIVPFAAAAILAFPFGPSSAMGRVRLVLDGLIVATSLAYIAWDLGLGGLESQARLGVMGGLLVVAYPAGDLVLLTLVGITIRRVRTGFPPMARLLGAAFLANLVADSGFAYLMLHGHYTALGSLTDAGWVAGFLLLAIAPLAPAAAKDMSAEDDVNMWQLVMPWVAVAGVIATSTYILTTAQQPGAIAGLLGSGVGVFFISSQVLTLNDAIRLLVRSRRAEAALRERTALLSEIIQQSPIGIARVSEQMRIIDANPKLSEMLAVPAIVLGGAPLGQFMSDDEVARARQRIEQMKSGAMSHAEVDGEMRSADGGTFWAHRRITPVRDTSGRLQYFLVMFEDVTEKHRTEEAARANLAELERINRLKSEFMSMVSHEFRTALTGIQGYSEVLSTDEVAPAEVKDFANDINSESLRLNRMITEMLDLDRIESGRIQLHTERVDLNALIAGAAERTQMSTDKNRIGLDLDPALPRVDADKDRLTQVVSNLLSNAVKYSPEGGDVTVTTRVVDRSVEVSVNDHGRGIPPEFISKIFGRYERYEGAGKAQVVGTGLGLAISQQIVQLHKGRIWVESTVGAGSTFRFTIPMPADGASAKVA